MKSKATVCLIGFLAGGVGMMLAGQTDFPEKIKLSLVNPDVVPVATGTTSAHTVVAAYRNRAGLIEGSFEEAAAQVLEKEGIEAKALEAGKILENLFRLDPPKAVRFSRFILPLIYPETYPTQETVGDLAAVNAMRTLGDRPPGSNESANTPLVAKLLLDVISNPERRPSRTPYDVENPGHEKATLLDRLTAAEWESPETYAQYLPGLLKAGVVELRSLPPGVTWKERQILGPLALEMARKDPEVLGTYMGRPAQNFLIDADAHRFLEDIAKLEPGKNLETYPVKFLADKIAGSDPQAGVDLLRKAQDPKLRSLLLQGLVEAGATTLLKEPERWAELTAEDRVQVTMATMKEEWVRQSDGAGAPDVSFLLQQQGVPRKEIFEKLESYYLDTVMDPSQGLALGMSMKDGEGVNDFLAGLSKNWAARDAVGMSQSLAAYSSGEVPDEVTLSLIREIPRDDPEAALTWAHRLQDPQARAAEIEAVLKRVARKDPQRAEALRTGLTDPKPAP